MSYLALHGYVLDEETEERFRAYCERDGKDPDKELSFLVNRHLDRVEELKKFFTKLKKEKVDRLQTYEGVEKFIGGHNED